jgi:hypothetical protein
LPGNPAGRSAVFANSGTLSAMSSWRQERTMEVLVITHISEGDYCDCYVGLFRELGRK